MPQKKISIRIDGELGPIVFCHCANCRKATASAFNVAAPVAKADYHLLTGEESLAENESSPGVYRVFCRGCGSPLFSTNAEEPDVVRIRVGIIDGTLRARPSAHYYVGQMANWWRIDDHLLRFETE